MWQQLYDSLKDRNFMVVAVAQDSRADAARPWIEQAQSTYWSLVDSGASRKGTALFGRSNNEI